MSNLSFNQIAEVAHQANRAICQTYGDDSQPTWADAPDWQIESCVAGVAFFEANPDATPEQMHESWLQQKLADGWVFGPEKDPEAKTHPCLIPYNQLPVEQQIKDHVFRAIVETLV